MTTYSQKRDGFRAQSRAELFDLLQEVMTVTYSQRLEEKRLDYERGLLKSYILETDLFRNEEKPDTPKKIRKLIKEMLTPEMKSRALVTIRDTDEDNFFEVTCTTNKFQCSIYLDASTDERFWLAYSISNSVPVDTWLDRVVTTKPNIDFVWLWPKFLEGVQSRGSPRGFGLDYDHRRFEDEDDVASYIKMQFAGGEETQIVYQSLKRLPVLEGKIVLAKVRLKTFRDDEDEEEKPDRFALEDVKYTGKFTVRGTDFGVHNANLNHVRRGYAQVIHELETSYALSWREDEAGDSGLQGYAINFIPKHPFFGVSRFCERVFNGSQPFRLLGFVQMKHDNYATINVVDLHTGGKLFFEVSPELITVYLPVGTCGNTIARLYTNLQHYLNTNFYVKADNGQQLFRR